MIALFCLTWAGFQRTTVPITVRSLSGTPTWQRLNSVVGINQQGNAGNGLLVLSLNMTERRIFLMRGTDRDDPLLLPRSLISVVNSPCGC